MQEQQLWKLIAGKLTGEASAAEMLVLRKYLQANTRLSNCMNTLTMFWQIPVDADENMPEPAFEKVMNRIQKF
jgi:hypothetical protein